MVLPTKIIMTAIKQPTELHVEVEVDYWVAWHLIKVQVAGSQWNIIIV